MIHFIFAVLMVFSLVMLVWVYSTVIGIVRGRGVPYVPLGKRQLSYVAANVKLNKDDRVIDLGCGDGRVLRLFEKMGVREVVGYEVNFWAWLKGVITNKLKKSKVKLYFKNFNKINISEYNVVYVFLLGSYLKRLKVKLEKELKKGSKVISFGFEVEGWEPIKVIHPNDKNQKLDRIFIYQI